MDLEKHLERMLVYVIKYVQAHTKGTTRASRATLADGDASLATVYLNKPPLSWVSPR